MELTSKGYIRDDKIKLHLHGRILISNKWRFISLPETNKKSKSIKAHIFFKKWHKISIQCNINSKQKNELEIRQIDFTRALMRFSSKQSHTINRSYNKRISPIIIRRILIESSTCFCLVLLLETIHCSESFDTGALILHANAIRSINNIYTEVAQRSRIILITVLYTTMEFWYDFRRKTLTQMHVKCALHYRMTCIKKYERHFIRSHAIEIRDT